MFRLPGADASLLAVEPSASISTKGLTETSRKLLENELKNLGTRGYIYSLLPCLTDSQARATCESSEGLLKDHEHWKLLQTVRVQDTLCPLGKSASMIGTKVSGAQGSITNTWRSCIAKYWTFCAFTFLVSSAL
jgi:hypothetical protein